MKNKASLALMEQLIMVLVFALAAALCLGIFARADKIAEDTARRETGALIAQNTAELLKSGGDPQTMALPEGYATEILLEGASFLLRPQAWDTPGLVTATIDVEFEGETVFVLKTGWQEVLP